MKIILSESQLQEGVGQLADELTRYYGRWPLTIIAVLTGSFVFMADLIRRIDKPVRLGWVAARSYRGMATSPGSLVVHSDLVPDIRGRDVLLLDDIFDTGRTLVELMSQLDERGPASIRSAVLLRKEGRQEVTIRPDHAAFTIPNEFVVGYGLDYNDAYRNLPYLAALEPHEIDREPWG